MNAIAKISDNIKSLLCASSQINSFTKAVQELVFNSIDAEATSIAVRIHIGDGKIQVIDNGFGINKNDIKVLGQNYMTSKLVDITTLKSMPNKYGFRGQSLANIVQVSKCVKITSRCEQSEETFTKTFEFGKEKQIVKSKARPSKGTTVEIKGFLYNLTIQKKCSNLLLQLQDIKSFLESTSLVHHNLLMSLRDDSTNDIVFKIHKNRDIYQTLSNLYGLEEKDVQKLQVEKNQYKVIAYIAKKDNELTKQLIFLNGKLLTGESNLLKAVNCKFSKQIKLNKAEKHKKFHDNQEESKNDGLPFYVIFFKCPYLDYSLRITSKNTIVDFKDWSEINKLIAKLVLFYNGDIIKIKEIKNGINSIQEVHKNKNTNTKDQVKQIINKILGSKPKAPVVSQMHNGVKGKQIKRKHKKRTQAKLTITKLIHHKPNTENNVEQIARASLDAELENTETNFMIADKYNITTPPGSKSKAKKTITAKVDNVAISTTKKKLKSEHKKEYNKISKKKKQRRIAKIKNNEQLQAKLALHCIFNAPTDSIKQRKKMLSKEAKELKNKSIPLEKRRRPKRDMVVKKETMKNCNVTEKNKNVSIQKTMNEVTIYESFPMAPHKLNIDVDNKKINNEKHSLLSTYDILKTILTQQNRQKEPNKIHSTETEREARNTNHELHLERPNLFGDTPIVTFNSHNYQNIQMGLDYVSHNLYNNDCIKQNNNVCDVSRKQNAFISKKSMDNFVSTRGYPKLFYKNKSFQSKRNILLKNTLKKAFNNRNFFDLHKNIFSNKEQSSYTIQFSESNDCNYNKYLNDFKAFDSQLFNVRNNTEESTSGYTLNRTPRMINLSDHPYSSNYLFHSSDVLQTANNVVKNTTVNAYMNEEICISYEPLQNHDTLTTDEGLHKSYEDSIRIHQDDLECYEGLYLNHATYTVEHQDKVVQENAYTDISGSITKVEDDIGPKSHVKNKLIITDPIQVCETILDSRETLRDEFETSFNKINDSFHKADEENIAEIALNKTEIAHNINQDDDYLDIEQIMNEIQISHHFVASNMIGEKVTEMESNNVDGEHDKNLNDNDENCAGNPNTITDVVNFKIQDRLEFLPKGMSQIFQNSNLKITCDPNSIQDYYNDDLYNEFAHKVRNTVEIFEPKIQEASDLVTKDIDKVNIKLKKDNACLKFDGESLKNCQVLGQVDEKFIAVIIKVKSNDSETLSEFLVLFDQHAVHERIRLETNLADYFTGTEWNTVKLDEVTLKMSSDDVRFLHNYKEKFVQFGLQWTILDNNDLSLNAIPEAILGKNPRPVDKIIRAVQSLIKEIIDNVKLQSGCVPLYPKSIMDLVFSEACRYAIKFGDQLSKPDCIELIRKLSECRTPFQCAHGRPVMAVIMENKPISDSYMISVNKLKEFRKKMAPKRR